MVLTITKDGNIVGEFQKTTDKDGLAQFEKTRGNNPNFPPPGTYTIDATATKDEASGECIGCLVVQVESDGTITVGE